MARLNNTVRDRPIESLGVGDQEDYNGVRGRSNVVPRDGTRRKWVDVLRFGDLSASARISNYVGSRIARVLNSPRRLWGSDKDTYVRLRLVASEHKSQLQGRYESGIGVVRCPVGVVFRYDFRVAASARYGLSLLIDGWGAEDAKVVRVQALHFFGCVSWFFLTVFVF